MKYQLDDIAEIAAKFIDLNLGKKKDLILITALPGVGKTTLAKEFAKQAQGIHFDLDDIKRVVVPEDMVTEGIDPPEYRYTYYAEAIRRLPDLYAKNPTQLVIMDETFHLQVFRKMWDDSAKLLNIRLHWVEAVCDKAIVEVAAGTRKMLFRYSQLCGTISGAVDAVRSAIPTGFRF